MSEANTKKSET